MFQMLFTVSSRGPRPLVAEIPAGNGEPAIFGANLCLPLGAAAAYYGLSVEVLRLGWVLSAIVEPWMDCGRIREWGVDADEWREALRKFPEVRRRVDRTRWPMAVAPARELVCA